MVKNISIYYNYKHNRWFIQEADSDIKTWNNGICTECGDGHYEFISASSHGRGASTTDYYYYKCDSCGNVIKVKHLYQN